MTSYNWYAITYSVGSSSAFGAFDSDPDYITDSVKIARYVVRSLGYPITLVLIAPLHIFTAFLSAIMKYSTIVNLAKISDNLLNVYGQDPTKDLTKAGIYDNLGAAFLISSMYGQLSIIRNSLHTLIYTASIPVTAGVQEYDLSTVIPAYTNSNVQITLIYHYPILYRSNAFDPMVNPGFNMASIMNLFGGVYSANAKLIIMPVFLTLLKMQSLLLSQQIRRSHIGFELRKNKVVFYPAFGGDGLICILYILKSDKYDNSIRQDVVNNVSNFPITNYIMYEDINMPGRNWIQRYTLALCKLILGVVRSKYASIPYPLGLTSLDGLTLRQLATAEQDKLVDELKGMLELSSMMKLIEKKKDMSLNLQIINSKVPLRIWIG